jgi:uncharacterized protein involved in type VI secretion and phage assembly
MNKGIVVGIVEDNRDPEQMHRIMVRFPVDGGVKSTWCRIASPMAGEFRGLVLLPDIGTEVILMYSYRSLHPYVIGAVYNGNEDKPKPYHNDDGEDNKRVFWSRNDHMVLFDDTAGEESVGIGAKASERLDVKSAPIHHVMDAANKKITEYCDGITHYQGARSFSVKCKSLTLKTNDCTMDAGAGTILTAKSIQINTGTAFRSNSPNTVMKKGGVSISSNQAPSAPGAKHHPTVSAS